MKSAHWFGDLSAPYVEAQAGPVSLALSLRGERDAPINVPLELNASDVRLREPLRDAEAQRRFASRVRALRG